MSKSKDECQEEYSKGKKDGKEEDSLSNWMYNNFSAPFTSEDDKKGKSYDKGYEEASGYSDDSDDSSCYLTTACVRYAGLSDDCLELRVLRNFRDNVLMKEPKGRKAVKEYYEVAPRILEGIKEAENVRDVFSSLRKEIAKAVRLVMSENFEEAFEHYKNMTINLKKEYLDRV